MRDRLPVRTADFERLFDLHAQPLYGFLVYRTGDRELAEDLVATTFERALRAQRRFDPRKASEKTWLYAIALNVLRDQARRRVVEERALECVASGVGGGAWEPGYWRVEDRDTVMGALHVLSDEERVAVALRYGAELTVPEIAKLTGEKLTTVEGRVYRALRRLRAELDD